MIMSPNIKWVQARIQEFLVEGDDMDEEKIGRGLGPP
jgi:hypothetical protein